MSSVYWVFMKKSRLAIASVNQKITDKTEGRRTNTEVKFSKNCIDSQNFI